MDELLARVVMGDDAAFDRLYEDSFGLIFRTVFAVLGDSAQAEEVTQEVFLEVWSTAPRYDSTLGTARRWMTTIARRRAIDRARHAQAARARDNRVAQRDGSLTEPDVIDQAHLNLESQRLHVALANLRAEQRDLLVLAYLRGVPYRELATRLDIPLGTVKSRVRLALAALRRKMSSV